MSSLTSFGTCLRWYISRTGFITSTARRFSSNLATSCFQRPKKMVPPGFEHANFNQHIGQTPTPSCTQAYPSCTLDRGIRPYTAKKSHSSTFSIGSFAEYLKNLYMHRYTTRLSITYVTRPTLRTLMYCTWNGKTITT